jgi:hypothetical protein
MATKPPTPPGSRTGPAARSGASTPYAARTVKPASITLSAAAREALASLEAAGWRAEGREVQRFSKSSAIEAGLLLLAASVASEPTPPPATVRRKK